MRDTLDSSLEVIFSEPFKHLRGHASGAGSIYVPEIKKIQAELGVKELTTLQECINQTAKYAIQKDF